MIERDGARSRGGVDVGGGRDGGRDGGGATAAVARRGHARRASEGDSGEDKGAGRAGERENAR